MRDTNERGVTKNSLEHWHYCKTTILYGERSQSRVQVVLFKVARLDFLGGIPPKFERQLCRRE